MAGFDPEKGDVWTRMSGSKVREKYIQLEGKPDGFVRTEADYTGRYMWSHGDEYGYADTIDQAKDWVEAARSFYPRKLRSLAG